MGSIAWNEQNAAHLLRRAGFGGPHEEAQTLVDLGLEGAVDHLINYEQVDDSAMEQALAQQNLLQAPPGKQLSLQAIQIWWLFRMINTKRPLLEKMTLFWHGHFATGISKVEVRELMFQQNQLFRHHALDNFQTILLGVSQDPAMIIWLDNLTNIKSAPNENYARELMELFTMGINDVIAGTQNYTEQDIHESARAFTGWTLRRGQFYFNSSQHDNGTKSFLGQTGNFNGDDIVAILAPRPATSRFMAKKLFEFFGYANPEPSIIQELADVYLANQSSIKAVMQHLFTMDAFYSDQALYANIKSPAEFVVGSIRLLQPTVGTALLPYLVNIMDLLQQVLFNPPTVKGWDGGLTWINTASILTRCNFADYLASLRGGHVGSFDPTTLLSSSPPADANATVDLVLNGLGPLAVPDETRKSLSDYLTDGHDPTSFQITPQTLDSKVRGLVHLVMSLPEYQTN
jgi:uncharacterized protein (DUF1800 family)